MWMSVPASGNLAPRSRPSFTSFLTEERKVMKYMEFMHFSTFYIKIQYPIKKTGHTCIVSNYIYLYLQATLLKTSSKKYYFLILTNNSCYTACTKLNALLLKSWSSYFYIKNEVAPEPIQSTGGGFLLTVNSWATNHSKLPQGKDSVMSKAARGSAGSELAVVSQRGTKGSCVYNILKSLSQWSLFYIQATPHGYFEKQRKHNVTKWHRFLHWPM